MSHNKITGPNAGGPRHLPVRTPLAARVGQFWRYAKYPSGFAHLGCIGNIVMKHIIVLSLAVVCGCLAPAFAQEATRASREEILAVYSFSPHTLTKEQISQKSKTLDTFWQKAKARREDYLPLLKAQLKEKDVPAFFLYDGSMLLLDLSDTAENRRIALQAMARCDLRDVDNTTYLRQVHRFATLGEDTTAAALHILDDSKFQAFIVEHALTLGQDSSLIIMLFPTDSTNWLCPAMKRLEVEADSQAQKSLLQLLWCAQKSEADAALADFSKATNKPAGSRDIALKLLAVKDKDAPSPKVSKAKQSEGAIRKARAKIMRRISDEALSEFGEMTLELMVIRRESARSK